uniref:Complex 1 LYR protein domain-containing protein n=1 Tax=Acrobeloides nanus TaxID=290746 RepID=A0A914D5J4_9BILA
MSRREVLNLYRRILKIARDWKSINPEDTLTERKFIRNEARTQFRENKSVTDKEKVKQLIEEAEKRIAIAQHYGIP